MVDVDMSDEMSDVEMADVESDHHMYKSDTVGMGSGRPNDEGEPSKVNEQGGRESKGNDAKGKASLPHVPEDPNVTRPKPHTSSESMADEKPGAESQFNI
jgi:hypothetical protein